MKVFNIPGFIYVIMRPIWEYTFLVVDTFYRNIHPKSYFKNAINYKDFYDSLQPTHSFQVTNSSSRW